jgi:hypothetical protein
MVPMPTALMLPFAAVISIDEISSYDANISLFRHICLDAPESTIQEFSIAVGSASRSAAVKLSTPEADVVVFTEFAFCFSVYHAGAFSGCFR